MSIIFYFFSLIKRYRAIINISNIILKVSPRNINAISNKGLALYHLGDFKGSLMYFEKAIGLEPNSHNSSRYYLWKSKILFDFRKYDEALLSCDNAISITPSYYNLYAKANILIALGRFEEAIEYLDKVIKLNPSSTRAYKDKATVLIYLSQYVDVLDCINKAFSVKKDDLEVYYIKGLMLCHTCSYKEADECFEKLISNHKYQHNGYYGKGLVLYYLHKNEEAIKYFDKAMGERMDLIATFIGKGMALADLGRSEEAISCFDTAINLDISKKLRVITAYVFKGYIFHKLERIKEGNDCYMKAKEACPVVAEIYTNRGLMLEKFGDRERAEMYIEVAKSISAIAYNEGEYLS